MSSRNFNNNNRNHKQKKFCGVCHKAGKPESEYTSHYTKSEPGSNGIVTCPIIKNNKCNKCEQYGHFQDHCSFVKNVVHDSKLYDSNHGFEKPKKVMVVAVEPDYEDLFPPLSGVKRSRDSVISNTNQYHVLERENDFDLKKKNGGVSYKTILKKEPKIVISEPKFESGLVDLHSYVKKEYKASNFIHHNVDIDMSKRILPVEINEDLMENYVDSDDEDWDGSWY
jgi:hypothetical protein